ncbi:hypothetical protein GO730_05815 [Spirosoma sp. HMF3257]|uniref:Uncharacterized protein n=1 Tax=Spirosoma telluris TaxID=2183553 RepID=A0A327NFI5_9BACT|nr:hypothetical protein [Spirosoma telluris]RAI73992.1 hypothetical protein HMF3257_05770 [Spirosoma telluris]
MRKKIVVSVPKHVKKYFLNPEFGSLEPDGGLYVSGRSLIGAQIAGMAIATPFVFSRVEPSGNNLTIWYSCRDKTHEVPLEKMSTLAKALDELFRRSLIIEVRALHGLCGGDYSRFIRSFLERYQIEPDVDVDFETIRKIYRDYLERVDKQTREAEKNIFA